MTDDVIVLKNGHEVQWCPPPAPLVVCVRCAEFIDAGGLLPWDALQMFKVLPRCRGVPRGDRNWFKYPPDARAA